MAFGALIITRLAQLVGNEDALRIEHNARIAEHIEQEWKKRFDALFDALTEQLLTTLEASGDLQWPADLLERIGALLLEHELQTVVAATTTITPAEYVRAAAGRAPKWPTDIARIRALWDQWRHTGRLPGRTAEQARAVKTLYIRRVQHAWQTKGATFITGEKNRVAGYGAKGTNKNNTGKGERAAVWNPDAFDRVSARAAIQQATRVSRARAYTIVETETTRYYNTVRINTYNAIDTVVAYLFICVRDAATTKWCKSRSGVVFFKATDLLRHNTPPCHYNCRSELLPLSRLNPAHRKLLENASNWAQNRALVPLLPEWNEGHAA